MPLQPVLLYRLRKTNYYLPTLTVVAIKVVEVAILKPKEGKTVTKGSWNASFHVVLKKAVWMSVLVLLCGIWMPLLASDNTIVRGPYLQLGTPTSIVVKWRTADSTESRVCYSKTLGGPSKCFTATPVPVTISPICEDTIYPCPSPTTMFAYEVTLRGLKADTKYYYSVQAGDGKPLKVQTNSLRPEWEGPVYEAQDPKEHFFVTAPTCAKPTRIWVLGDPGTDWPGKQDAVRDAFYESNASNPNGQYSADLWLLLGDNAYVDWFYNPDTKEWVYGYDEGSDGALQTAFHNYYYKTLRQSVVWPTRGNHEPFDGGYYDFFTLPTKGEAGGVPSGTEEWYSFDYGNIHFISLDSSEPSDLSVGGPMYEWVKADAARTDKDWVIAFWHHPPYSKGSHDSDNNDPIDGDPILVTMRENFLPVLEGAGVDLVLSGHSHSLERSFLLDGLYGFSWDLTDANKIDAGSGQEKKRGGAYQKPARRGPHQGTVYMVAGSSGDVDGRNEGTFNHPVMVSTVVELGSVVLDINGNRLDAKFINDRGQVRDHFTIVK